MRHNGFSRHQFSADYTISMLGFDFRQGQQAMSALFTPYRLGSLKLRNRIVIAPMCQYSAEEGRATDWHLIHLGNLALSGAGLLIIEATAVLPEGRISPDDAGRRWRPRPSPSQKVRILRSSLDHDGLAAVRDAFVEAARRSARLGFDAIQLHGAHGHLLHQFLSPLANQREDDYGGSLENRMRFPLEVFDAVRRVFPVERPVSMPVSGTDWAEGGWDLDQTIAFAKVLAARGCSAIHVSSGGMTPAQKIPVGPSYQVPLARAVKAATNLPTVAVGLIAGYDQAEAIVGTGDADFVALARTILYDPRWPWHAGRASWRDRESSKTISALAAQPPSPPV
jgi:2,4-dienoyl-CoA reductase-like NADH-dependent reductase (Old Yellow Enzyme family)